MGDSNNVLVWIFFFFCYLIAKTNKNINYMFKLLRVTPQRVTDIKVQIDTKVQVEVGSSVKSFWSIVKFLLL